MKGAGNGDPTRGAEGEREALQRSGRRAGRRGTGEPANPPPGDDRFDIGGCFWFAVPFAGCGAVIYVVMIVAMAVIGVVWFFFS